MRSIKVFFAVAILIPYGCSQQDNHGSENLLGNDSPLSASPKYYDFGEVTTQNDSIEYVFQLNNLGKKDISIQDVDVSCKCIVVNDVPDIIPIGKTALIKGKIGITGNLGTFNKALFVNYNHDEVLLLRIKGEVKK